MESFSNGAVRLLKHESSIIAEDNLDRRWEEATGETVDEVIFLSRHTAVSNRPALTVHPIGSSQLQSIRRRKLTAAFFFFDYICFEGVPHICEGEYLPQGGRPGWAGLPNPRIGPWLRLMKKIAEANGLIPEFEVNSTSHN